MPDARVLTFAELPSFDRGSGVSTKLLVHHGLGSENITTSITTFSPGTGIALHWHNCDESVTVLEGEPTAVVDGQELRLRPYDTTYVPAGVPHRFRNETDRPARILGVYAAGHVTRTFAETGETVRHLSAEDMAVGKAKA
jgi:quercetin dioxygenase-like cupin family protein